MANPKLEDVFKTSGVPSHTFVQPAEYERLIVSLRTPGRGVILEGPSGIGKTTAVEKVLSVLGSDAAVTKLSARKKEDVEYIRALPELGKVGRVIIDDFHRLADEVKDTLANYLKVLADEESGSVKLVLIGINLAGRRLVQLSGDLNNRIDIIHFESNSDSKVEELIQKGENALNFDLNIRDEIVKAARGSFYIAQLLAQESCVKGSITERLEKREATELSFEAIRANVWERLSGRFEEPTKAFCRGPRQRSDGRAPYLHLMRWLADSQEWSISIPDTMKNHSEMKGSVSQIVDKHYLEKFIHDHPETQEVLHYDSAARLLSAEDPQFVFYIRNISWNSFARSMGFTAIPFNSKYDFALSFAGEDRDVAEIFCRALVDQELEVFYDKNEEHRMVASDLEEYLKPIYQSEAAFVICLFGQKYPEKIWTRIESDAFKKRLPDGEVITICIDDARPSYFDEMRKFGFLTFSRNEDRDTQVEKNVEILLKKRRERQSRESA